MFAYLRMPALVIYNIAIVFFYVLFLWLLQKNYYRLVVTLVHFEVCGFVVVTTLLLGWNFGFALYLISLTTLLYFNPFVHRPVIYVFSALDVITFFLLKTTTINRVPVISTEPEVAILFDYFNCVGCFTIILVGILVSKIAINNMQQERDRFAYDQLTGAYLREHFIQKVESVLKKNADKEYVLFLTNIVGLKYFNEIFSEEKGNEVLKTQAAMLQQDLKTCICFGRVAGDEFAVFLEADKFDEKHLIESNTILQERFSNDLYKMQIHTGIYHISKEDSVGIMLDKAEMAVLSIQGQYETICAYYTDNMLKKSLKERRVLSEFEQALAEGQFCFYLQPQISIEGFCLGAEALVRWIHPVNGLVLPNDFIPILEKTCLIWKLDLFIWEEAVKKLKEWHDIRNTNTSISVNISPQDFVYLDIYQVFVSLVEKYDVSPKRLKLEITETAFFDDPKKQLEVIGRLQAYGFEIEIDDFGSGFSSLNLLKDIKANVIKIDMMFLDKTENMQRSWEILNSVIELAGKIGMETISEGVETKEQMTQLRQLGCNMYQGYYFSKPIPVEEFESKYL